MMLPNFENKEPSAVMTRTGREFLSAVEVAMWPGDFVHGGVGYMTHNTRYHAEAYVADFKRDPTKKDLIFFSEE